MQTIGPGKKSSGTSLYRDVVKKQVGIITLFHNSLNYGGVLQAYALHKTVQNLGFDCEVICYSKNRQTTTMATVTGVVKRELVKDGSTLERMSRVFDFFIRAVKYEFKKVFAILVQKVYLDRKISLRRKAFSAFNNEYVSSTKLYTDDTISECVRVYDIFVCGSDQIWHPKLFTPVYFLGFVPESKLKIAYAPSIALNFLTDSEIARMQPLINRLDAISVREEQGKKLVEMMTNEEVHCVLDPTLLLNYDEWKKVIIPYPIKRPYIFCYMLGKSKKNKQFVLHAAEELGVPIVTMPFVANESYISLTYGDLRVYDAGPGEFLSLIQNAEYVITDSFHGLVFSIIFRKKFFVLKRSDDNIDSSMNSRVYNLLKICRLEDRLLNDVRSLELGKFDEEVDYAAVYDSLVKERERSLEFLVRAFSK